MHFLIDGHSHFTLAESESLYVLLQQHAIKVVFSITNLAELSDLQQIKRRFPEQVYLSLGLHPWESGTQALAPFWDALATVDMVGEVGLDSVWCEVDLETQFKVFVQQVQWAQRLQKPLVLHTKGQEATIAGYLAQQSLDIPILVHWYSGNKAELLQFKALNCYFSIGPDIRTNREHFQVLESIDRSYIITESDGLAAIAWAKGSTMSDYSIVPEVLSEQLQIIAQCWGCSTLEAIQQVSNNFERFSIGCAN